MVKRRVFAVFSFLVIAIFSAKSQPLPQLGVSGSLVNDSLFYASGFRLLGTAVSNLIGPGVSNEQFDANLKLIKAARCKVYMCNVLFPGRIKIAGPEADEKKVLRYLDTVLARAQHAGIKNLILGSGGPRSLPEGYNEEKARSDFAQLARKMATKARKHHVTIIFENLNSSETNFITTLRDAAAMVRKVNHPNFKLNADIFHMMRENEPPDEILKAGKLVVYCEIAERESRTYPGVKGDDFKPYFRALKAIGFKGPIMIEGKSDDLKKELPQAYNYLQAQLKEVYQH